MVKRFQQFSQEKHDVPRGGSVTRRHTRRLRCNKAVHCRHTGRAPGLILFNCRLNEVDIDERKDFMDTVGSIFIIALVLASIFIPQALALYFSDRERVDHEEYIPDGR